VGHKHVVECLLLHGANVHHANRKVRLSMSSATYLMSYLQGETALMLASKGGHHETVRYLLSKGTKINESNYLVS
jgi:ankyrin repeat protein